MTDIKPIRTTKQWWALVNGHDIVMFVKPYKDQCVSLARTFYDNELTWEQIKKFEKWRVEAVEITAVKSRHTRERFDASPTPPRKGEQQ